MARSDDGAFRTSNSELKTWKRCRRKWWLAYYRRLQWHAPSVSGPLALGTRVHLALADYYSGRFDPQAALEVFQDSAREDYDRAIEADPLADMTDFQKETELGRIMLEGYFQWAEEEGVDEGLEVDAPEQALEARITMGDPEQDEMGVFLRGKLDVRVRRRLDGSRLFIDHKTAASFDPANLTIIMDEQMLTYHLLERLAGVDPGQRADGGLYSMLRKVKRTVRAKPPFYQRIEVSHNDIELRNFYTRIHGEIWQILQAERLLDTGTDHQWVVPPTPTRDCKWDCEFSRVCPLFDDGSRAEDFLADYYVTVDPDARYKDETKEKGLVAE